MASSILHNTSFLKDRAATARACCPRRPAVLHDHLQGVFRVARGLREAGAEVGQTGGVDPGVQALERGEAFRHQVGGEELRKRGGHGLDPRAGAGEVDVGVHGEPDPGDHVPVVPHLFARQADSLAQAQPGLYAALLLLPSRRGRGCAGSNAAVPPCRGSWRGWRRPCGGCSPGSRSGWPSSPGSGAGRDALRSS